MTSSLCLLDVWWNGPVLLRGVKVLVIGRWLRQGFSGTNIMVTVMSNAKVWSEYGMVPVERIA